MILFLLLTAISGFTQMTRCIISMEMDSAGNEKKLTVFDRSNSSAGEVKRVLQYDFTDTAGQSKPHEMSRPVEITDADQITPLLPDSQCTNSDAYGYCTRYGQQNRLIFSGKNDDVLLFATSFNGSDKWMLEDISDTAGPINFGYTVTFSDGPDGHPVKSITSQSFAEIALPGVEPGDEVFVVLTGKLLECMCGGIDFYFGPYQSKYELSDPDGKGYVVIRHMFVASEQGILGLTIRGAEHDMLGIVSSILVCRVGHQFVAPVAEPKKLTVREHSGKSRVAAVNLKGQVNGLRTCPSLTVHTSGKVLRIHDGR